MNEIIQWLQDPNAKSHTVGGEPTVVFTKSDDGLIKIDVISASKKVTVYRYVTDLSQHTSFNNICAEILEQEINKPLLNDIYREIGDISTKSVSSDVVNRLSKMFGIDVASLLTSRNWEITENLFEAKESYSKSDLARMLTINSISGKEFKAGDVTDDNISDFNKGWKPLFDKNPNFNPYGDDVEMDEVDIFDDFMDLLVTVSKSNPKINLFEAKKMKLNKLRTKLYESLDTLSRSTLIKIDNILNPSDDSVLESISVIGADAYSLPELSGIVPDDKVVICAINGKEIGDSSEHGEIINVLGTNLCLMDKSKADLVPLTEAHTTKTNSIARHSLIKSAIKKDIAHNKILNQSPQAILVWAKDAVTNIRLSNSPKVAELINRIFLDDRFNKSVKSIFEKNGEITDAERNYLSWVIKMVCDNPFDLSFYDEAKIYAETY